MAKQGLDDILKKTIALRRLQAEIRGAARETDDESDALPEDQESIEVERHALAARIELR